jgi:hypothetical protein
VSSGTRLAALPLIGPAMAVLARWRGRLSVVGAGSGTSSQVAPAAVAGLAAVSLALVPLLHTDTHQGVTAAAAPRTPASVVVADAAAPVADAAAPAAPTVAAPVAAPAVTPEASSDAAPTPSADLGVAQVYSGPEATTYWSQRIDEAPIHVDLDPILKVGLDPVAMLKKALGVK